MCRGTEGDRGSKLGGGGKVTVPEGKRDEERRLAVKSGGKGGCDWLNAGVPTEEAKWKIVGQGWEERGGVCECSCSCGEEQEVGAVPKVGRSATDSREGKGRGQD